MLLQGSELWLIWVQEGLKRGVCEIRRAEAGAIEIQRSSLYLRHTV